MEISEEESELYDRQIRLWGLDAQNKLRNANVLIAGLGGLGAEVAKNLMLSGLKSLTLMDDKDVSLDDFASQFLVSRDSVGENRAKASQEWTQELNPMVELIVSEESVDSQPEDYFQQFDVVILTDQKYDTVCRVNEICRLHNIRFQAGGVFGWCGYAFSDFNDQTFRVPKPWNSEEVREQKQDEADTVKNAKVPKKFHYPSFEHAMNPDFASKKLPHTDPSTNPTIPTSYFLIRVLLRILNEWDGVTVRKLRKAVCAEVSRAQREGVDTEHMLSEDFKYYHEQSIGHVCAFLGGVIAQEAIKAISLDGIPFKNLFLYSALHSTGDVVDLPLVAG